MVGITIEDYPEQTSVRVKCQVNGFDPTLNYGAIFACFKVANPKDKTFKTFSVRRPMKMEILLEHTFNELIPDTLYTIDVDFISMSGTPSTSMGSVLGRQSITFRTEALDGTFKVTNSSASVIAVELSDLTALEYATTVKLSYKREDDTEWRLSTTKDIEANISKTIAHVFTGLTRYTYYDIKAEIFKDEELIKTFELVAYTKYHDHRWDDILPYVIEVVAVPNTGKMCLKAGYSNPPSWEEGEVGLHLFKYIEEDYYPEVGGVSDMTGFTHETAGDTCRYMLGLINHTDSQDRFNFTEPFTVHYPQYTWDTKVAGQPLIVSAEDVWNMADSLFKAHRYQVLMEEVSAQIEYNHERRQSALDSLKGLMSSIRVGGEITADIINAVDLLAITFLETDSTAIDSRLNAIEEAQGEIIDAVDINDMISLVTDALATI